MARPGVTLKWTGREFLRHIENDLIVPRLATCGVVVRDDARGKTQEPKTGREQVTRGGIHYNSSAPGEPLASPTHKAEMSINSESGFEGKEPAVRIGTNHKLTVRHIVGLNENEGPRDPLTPAMMDRRAECIRILKG